MLQYTDIPVISRIPTLLADWVDNIFPTSKCQYVFSMLKYSQIKSLKSVHNFRGGDSGKI